MEEIFNMNETQTDNVKSEQKPTHNRNVLSFFLSASTKIQTIISPNINGTMSFTVNTNDLGFSPDDFLKYHREIFSNFVVDFIGEFLIRDNLRLFVPYVTSMGIGNYLKAVGHCKHVRFGMSEEKGKMVFMFHISLLQEILTEDFRIS